MPGGLQIPDCGRCTAAPPPRRTKTRKTSRKPASPPTRQSRTRPVSATTGTDKSRQSVERTDRTGSAMKRVPGHAVLEKAGGIFLAAVAMFSHLPGKGGSRGRNQGWGTDSAADRASSTSHIYFSRMVANEPVSSHITHANTSWHSRQLASSRRAAVTMAKRFCSRAAWARFNAESRIARADRCQTSRFLPGPWVSMSFAATDA